MLEESHIQTIHPQSQIFIVDHGYANELLIADPLALLDHFHVNIAFLLYGQADRFWNLAFQLEVGKIIKIGYIQLFLLSFNYNPTRSILLFGYG